MLTCSWALGKFSEQMRNGESIVALSLQDTFNVSCWSPFKLTILHLFGFIIVNSHGRMFSTVERLREREGEREKNSPSFPAHITKGLSHWRKCNGKTSKIDHKLADTNFPSD